MGDYDIYRFYGWVFVYVQMGGRKVKTIGNEKFCAEWMQGYNDCKNGVPHENKGDAHKRGYGTRYEEEQLMEKGVARV